MTIMICSLRRMLRALINPKGLYVDVTFGGGGHSKAILEQLTTGKLYAFDQDPDAKANLPEHPNLVFIAANFRYIKNHLRLQGARFVDGILADLGVSSHQFDEGERGFSIRFDGPLDMRMNPGSGISAAEVLETYEEQALYDLFRKHTDIKGLSHWERTAYGTCESSTNYSSCLAWCVSHSPGDHGQTAE